MKKILKTVLCVSLSALLLLTPALAEMGTGGTTDRFDSGIANESETLVWEMSGSKGTIELVIKPDENVTLPDSDHPEYSVMADYKENGSYSDAPWTLVGTQSRLVNSLTVAEGITVIGEYSFYNQSSMTGVTFYDTLNTVKENAFHNCNKLTTIIFNGTKSQWEKIDIKDGNEPLLQALVICTKEDEYLKGDVNGNYVVDDKDVIHLLFYTFFPDEYSVNQPVDFNGDEQVNRDDALRLLYYIYFPEYFILN